jgi:glycosyltransferase involved in cell wall biosynthesis
VREPDLRRPLEIALLSPCFWPEVRRGTERFARELSDRLIAQGQKPSLITSHRGRLRRTVEDGLPVTRLPRPPQRLLLRNGFEAYLTHVPLTYMALRTGRYDIAHALYPTDAVAAGRWRRRTGRPALLSYMGVPRPEWLRAARGRLEVLRRAVAETDAVVVLSRYAAEVFAHSMGTKPHVIAPGVDLEAFRPSAPRSTEPTIVCSAAVEEPRKNVALLLEAFARIRERHPSARLLLSRPRDLRAAQHAGVDLRAPGVQWLDLDDRPALARANSEAWLAVLPAVGEAFGLVLIEALACGTPVVGYKDGGIPEVIDGPGVGRVFDRLAPDALAQTVLAAFELIGDPLTPDRCRARARAFSIDACTERYLSLYRELCGAPGSDGPAAIPGRAQESNRAVEPAGPAGRRDAD